MRIVTGLAFLTCLAAAPAAHAQSYADGAVAAMRDTCPALMTGKLSANDEAALRKIGFEKMADDIEASATAGGVRPEGLHRVVDGEKLDIMFYPGKHCMVATFGDRRASAQAAVKAYITADGYKPFGTSNPQPGIDMFGKYDSAGRKALIVFQAIPAENMLAMTMGYMK